MVPNKQKKKSNLASGLSFGILLSVALLPIIFLTCGADSRADRFARNSFDPRTGIPILFYWEENPLPQHWQRPPISGKIYELEDYESGMRSLRAVKKAMDVYPRTLLRRSLTKVYCPQNLNFFGLPYGATNSRRNIYLSNPGREFGYSEVHLQRVFHHELSSILLRNYEEHFDTTTWRQFLPEDFHYATGGKDAIHKGKSSQYLDNTLNEQGFMNEYSMSSRENDINEIVEYLFVPTERFWIIVDAVPALRGKVELIIDFYSSLHPAFSEEYFRGLLEE